MPLPEATMLDRFQAQPIADCLRHVGLILDDQHTHALKVTSRCISPAYRKPHTAIHPKTKPSFPNGPWRLCQPKLSLVAVKASTCGKSTLGKLLAGVLEPHADSLTCE
jgi:hypothetical protein